MNAERQRIDVSFLFPLIDRFAATLKRTLEIMKYLKFMNASDCTNNSVPPHGHRETDNECESEWADGSGSRKG